MATWVKTVKILLLVVIYNNTRLSVSVLFFLILVATDWVTCGYLLDA
jgi:hypothetical protein